MVFYSHRGGALADSPSRSRAPDLWTQFWILPPGQSGDLSPLEGNCLLAESKWARHLDGTQSPWLEHDQTSGRKKHSVDSSARDGPRAKRLRGPPRRPALSRLRSLERD